MFIDITYKITTDKAKDVRAREIDSSGGHLGTHFDVMDKEFPLDYVEREAIVFDVSQVTGRDITVEDIDLSKVEKDMFVAFYSGFIEEEGYGTRKYFAEHPQLSYDLIEALLDAEVSIIALDFTGVRRGKEHTPADQACADRNVFVVENLCNLKALLNNEKSARFIANTYPVNYVGMTGLPCRVVAKV